MFTIRADRATQECERLQTPYMAFGDLDPPALMASNGMGLVSLLMTTLPDEVIAWGKAPPYFNSVIAWGKAPPYFNSGTGL